jgi:hypothetical protein
LKEKSRAPKRCPHKTAPEVEKEVIRYRRRVHFGAARLKREFGLKCSVGAIARILGQNGLTRRRKKKYQKKRDLRAVKSQYPPLTRFQMDTKYLNDIANYWPQMVSLDLPRYQYTVRCLKTGATFLGYGSELSVAYAELTARRLLEHLGSCGVDVTEVIFQTDRGTEFDGTVVRGKEDGFTHTIEEEFKAHHRVLLRSNPNANADVESFHSLEETEFFDIERFRNRQNFFEKVTIYQDYFNLARLNSYKGWKSPLEILKDSEGKISPNVLLLPVLDLDRLFESQMRVMSAPRGADIQVGHDVPIHPGKSKLSLWQFPRKRQRERACSPKELLTVNQRTGKMSQSD